MRSLLIIPALAAASLSFGLTIGDIAPTLKVETVVKGKAVNLTRGLHVVEFWATWCGPCKQSIPHLTELAKKYKGKCDFTGVSVWENGDNQLGQVKKFVTDMGPKMNYNVDFDGTSKVMATTWMQAAHQNGIPAAFLVKDGKILWIGHPMGGLDEAIGQVIDGKFNVSEAKAKFDQQAAEQEKEMKAQAGMQKVMAPLAEKFKAKDWAGALTALDGIEASHPDMKTRLESIRFTIMLQENSPELLTLAQRFVSDDFKSNPQMLNSLAWGLIDPAHPATTPHNDVALVLAKGAADASSMKDPEILDTYALALSKTGDKKQALAIQTQAVEMLKATKGADPAMIKDLESRLDQYKKDAS